MYNIILYTYILYSLLRIIFYKHLFLRKIMHTPMLCSMHLASYVYNIIYIYYVRRELLSESVFTGVVYIMAIEKCT